MASNPSLLPEIGPDGLPREAPVIAYTEKVCLSLSKNVIVIFLCSCCFIGSDLGVWQIIAEEQLQLKKYVHFPFTYLSYLCPYDGIDASLSSIFLRKCNLKVIPNLDWTVDKCYFVVLCMASEKKYSRCKDRKTVRFKLVSEGQQNTEYLIGLVI